MKISDITEGSVIIKKVDWNNDPKIGWFMESNPFTLYYGTQKDKINAILENGIFADESGLVKCALEPHTAFSHSAILTESTSDQERVVFIIEMPQSFSDKNPVLIEEGFDKVSNKELYEGWGKSDVEYYALIEASVPKVIPVECIKGYMVRDDS